MFETGKRMNIMFGQSPETILTSKKKMQPKRMVHERMPENDINKEYKSNDSESSYVSMSGVLIPHKK
jgi:hypothetical protein